MWRQAARVIAVERSAKEGAQVGSGDKGVSEKRLVGKASPRLRVGKQMRLLLDSRVVDVPMAYDPPFVVLSSLKPLFFNSLKNKFRVLDSVGA